MNADRLGAVALIDAAIANDSPEGSIVIEAIEQGADVDLLDAAYRLGRQDERRRQRAIVSRRQRENASHRKNIHLLRNLHLLGEFITRLHGKHGRRSPSKIAKDIGDGRIKWQGSIVRLCFNGVIKALERACEAKYSIECGKVKGVRGIVAAIESQGCTL